MKGFVVNCMRFAEAIAAIRALVIEAYRFRSHLSSVAANAPIEASFYQS
jgi:hypothetical protein